jgi:hypothetical protein
VTKKTYRRPPKGGNRWTHYAANGMRRTSCGMPVGRPKIGYSASPVIVTCKRCVKALKRLERGV